MDINTQRLHLLVTKDLKENKKTYLMYVGTLLASSIIAVLLWVWGVWYGNDNTVTTSILSRDIVILGVIIAAIGGLFLHIAISITFNPLNRRDKRLNYLLLPASLTEKFLSRLIITTSFAIISLLVVILITEAFSILLQMLLFGTSASIMIETLKLPSWRELFIYTDYLNNNTHYLNPLLPHLLFQYSVYLLGSAIFRKNAFVKTVIAFTVFYAVVATVGIIVGDLNLLLLYISPNIWFFILLALTSFNIWFSHRLFCKTYVTGFHILGK